MPSVIVQHKPSSSGVKSAKTDQGICYGHTENNGFILYVYANKR